MSPPLEIGPIHQADVMGADAPVEATPSGPTQPRSEYVISLLPTFSPSKHPHYADRKTTIPTLRQPTPPFENLHDELYHTIMEARRNIRKAVREEESDSKYYLPFGHRVHNLTRSQRKYRTYITNRIVGLFIESSARSDTMPLDWDPLASLFNSSDTTHDIRLLTKKEEDKRDEKVLDEADPKNKE